MPNKLKASKTGLSKGRVKLGKLKAGNGGVKDLNSRQTKKIMGGKGGKKSAGDPGTTVPK